MVTGHIPSGPAVSTLRPLGSRSASSLHRSPRILPVLQPIESALPTVGGGGRHAASHTRSASSGPKTAFTLPLRSSGSDERRSGTIFRIASKDAVEVETPPHGRYSGARAGRSSPFPSASGSCPQPPARDDTQAGDVRHPARGSPAGTAGRVAPSAHAEYNPHSSWRVGLRSTFPVTRQPRVIWRGGWAENRPPGGGEWN
jgi:hypothetical protein